MSKWLAPFRGPGLMGLANQDMSRLISEGADIVMGYRRNPMTPRFVTTGPTHGVPVIRDENALELFVAGLIAASVRQGEWGKQRFYYPCSAVPNITHTRPWRDMERGLLRHDVEPMLTYERDIHHFDRMDWMQCVLRLAIL